jgi:hypothetical protein
MKLLCPYIKCKQYYKKGKEDYCNHSVLHGNGNYGCLTEPCCESKYYRRKKIRCVKVLDSLDLYLQ